MALAGLIVVDLVFKLLITQSFQPTEMNEVITGFFSIGRIQTLRGAFGFQNSAVILLAAQLAFQVFLVLLAVRVFRRELHWTFRLAFALIIAGWLGNYLDWIMFSNGQISYVSTEYFYFHFLPPVLSLSVVLTTLGWILLLFSVVVFFKDVKLIFFKTENLAQAARKK